MRISNLATKYTVLAMVLIIIIGIWYSYTSGNNQNNNFINQQTDFHLAMDLFQQGRYEEAQPYFQITDDFNSNSDYLKYNVGLNLANIGEWERSQKEFKKVIELNPYKIEDALFMIQFAEILIKGGNFEEARIVLEHCKVLPTPDHVPDYENKVELLLEELSTV